ncbi:hypothetical protein PBI_CANTARE_11 [Brevibacterium phage Cantare]|uniref:Uncharacterized protein n=1 Tax=Brevibacterium phage Cantare TaxID=2338395 RepID=A0A3G3LYL3_9CAUD|nr:hypothetical protein PQD70_gp011 [Brevibacterium phage Cantare]AYQ99232.1 hypothetical protein PBI_CANTARE_11 [Brevibacterium phage Cantare]
MSIDNLINRALTIEEKAIRKVRTVEGARMYGQPIGTVITRDMIERAKRKREREKNKGKNKINASTGAGTATPSNGAGKRSASDILLEIEHVQAGIDKLKAKPDTGVASTRKRRERQIAKAEERIKELQASIGESNNSKTVRGSSVKKGDKVFHDGKWKTVDRSESWKGDQQVHFTDGTKTSFKRGENASVWMDDNEGTEHHKRQTEADAKRKKDEDDKAKAEQKKKDDYKRLSRTASELKPGDVVDTGSENGDVISRIEKEDNGNIRIFFEGDSMPKGLRTKPEAIFKLKDTAKSDGKDSGSTSEPEFRELRAGIIKAGDLIRHKGEWKKVEFADSGNGKTMLSLEGVAEDVIVPSDRAFEVQYPDGKKPPKGTSTPKRKPGTSLFGGAKPKDSEGDKPTTDDSAGKTSGKASVTRTEDGYILDLGDGSEPIVARGKVASKAKFIAVASKPFKYGTRPHVASGTRENAEKGFRSYYKEAPIILEIPNEVGASSSDENGSPNVSAPEAGKPDTDAPKAPTKPKVVVPAPDKFAEANDVHIESRPLTGDEVSARAVKYEEEAVAQVKKYRESRKGKRYITGKESRYTPTEKEFNELETFPSDKTPSSIDDLKWADSELISDTQFARWGNMTLVRVKGYRDNESIHVKFGSGEVASYSSYSMPSSRNPRVGEPDFFEKVKSSHGDFLTRELPKRVKREEAPFWDYWNGIRGIDWMADDETDASYKKKADFVQKNKEESARLGVSVEGNFDPEQHAVLNSVLETYQERYPGLLSKNINGFGMVSGTNGFVGAFHANVSMGRSLKGSIGKEPIGKGANRLSFNNAYYGDNGEKSTDKWVNLEIGGMMTGQFVGGDRVDLAEKMGLKPDHVHAMYTTNHEIGHSIGSWIFGETGVDDDRGRAQLRNDAGRAEQIANRYSDRVSKVLQKFKIMDDDRELKRYVNTAMTGDLGDGMMARLKRAKVINQTALSAHLSHYGATNLHEVMAETWASYSMDENPTEFALALGEVMEDLLLELSEESGLVPSEEKGISLRDALMNKLHALSNN